MDFGWFKKFHNIKIGGKLLLTYILVVFLPLLLVGFIFNYSMRSMIVNNAMREATVNVDRTYSRLNEVMRLFMDISYKMQMDQNLENLLMKEYQSTQEVFDTYYQYFEINNIINLYSREIRRIKIYANNKTILDSGQFIKITPEITDLNWYKNITEAGGRICWQYLYDENRDNYDLSLTRLIKANTSRRTLGALIINVNEDYLNSLIRNEPYDTFFIDDLGNIFASSDRGMIGRKIQDSVISETKDMSDGSLQIEYLGKPAKAIVKRFVPSVYNGRFMIVSIVPISVIEKQADKTALLSVAIIGSSLLLALILIFIFTRAISMRIKRLSRNMHTVAMGDFDLSPAIEGEDEIGQLSKDLIVMTNSLKELVNEVYITKAQKDQLTIRQREIKLKMLANQINPHFLFNALETIRMKAHTKGEDELAEIVKLLGKIMRKNLEIGSEMITLDSEIDLVQCYLEIQKFRYGERINYSIEFESEDIRNYKTLPLIIQPLVENAIIHGLELKEGEGHISIRLFRRNFNLVVTIQDDGDGMPPEKLQEVLDSLNDVEDMPGKRIGLKNIHQRLKLFYGEEYGLRIFSDKAAGTRIEIIMPGGG